MWYPFKFYKNLSHVFVEAELGGLGTTSRSHARAYRRALRNAVMPAAVIAETTAVNLKLVGWSTTVRHEFDALVLRIETSAGPIYVQTSSVSDHMQLLTDTGPFTGWRTSIEGFDVTVFKRGSDPPDRPNSLALEMRQIPDILRLCRP